MILGDNIYYGHDFESQLNAANANTVGAMLRLLEQRGLVQREVERADIEIKIAQIRQTIATEQLRVHGVRRQQSTAEETYLRSKFTKRELFDWLGPDSAGGAYRYYRYYRFSAEGPPARAANTPIPWFPRPAPRLHCALALTLPPFQRYQRLLSVFTLGAGRARPAEPVRGHAIQTSSSPSQHRSLSTRPRPRSDTLSESGAVPEFGGRLLRMPRNVGATPTHGRSGRFRGAICRSAEVSKAASPLYVA